MKRLLPLLALVLVGCGSGGEPSEGAPATHVSTTAPATSTATTEPLSPAEVALAETVCERYGPAIQSMWRSVSAVRNEPPTYILYYSGLAEDSQQKLAPLATSAPDVLADEVAAVAASVDLYLAGVEAWREGPLLVDSEMHAFDVADDAMNQACVALGLHVTTPAPPT